MRKCTIIILLSIKITSQTNIDNDNNKYMTTNAQNISTISSKYYELNAIGNKYIINAINETVLIKTPIHELNAIGNKSLASDTPKSKANELISSNDLTEQVKNNTR